MRSLVLFLTLTVLASDSGWTQSSNVPPGERMVNDYFERRTAELRSQCLAPYRSLENWQTSRPQLQEELREMLGLNPWPDRTPLEPVVTGHIEQEDIRVEKLHFQSLPGLYVTANLYLPKDVHAPLPTVLYVCGHAIAKEGDRSFGNKVPYQHHGIWFAQHGYACLIIDTIHRGEIEGIHHGTYQYGMWWWNSRGYTSAGIEAWNSIRALDYLATRREVDMDRIGITGRSGGGVYSWWTAVIDERIKVVVPVAGMTDLQNQVVDGVVDGHCDCMFMVNTYRWDFPKIAALVAPRPLLIANTDKDSIFPLDGVIRLHSEVRKIYELYDASDQLGLLITEGPHKDTQDLQVPTFRWFNRFLKQSQPLIDIPAQKRFSNQDLYVFQEFPEDAINQSIQETFVPPAPLRPPPANATDWDDQKMQWLQSLREKSFRSWPQFERPPVTRNTLNHSIPGATLSLYAINVQQRIQLPLYVLIPDRSDLVEELVLTVLDELNGNEFHQAFQAAIQSNTWPRFAPQDQPKKAFAWIAPRGVGPTTWEGGTMTNTQVRRRFMLLGETLDSMRVYDIIRAAQGVRAIPSMGRFKLRVEATGNMAVNALYASLFHDSIDRLELTRLPENHREGPDYLNVSKIWHLHEALAACSQTHDLTLNQADEQLVRYTRTLHRTQDWQTVLSINP